MKAPLNFWRHSAGRLTTKGLVIALLTIATPTHAIAETIDCSNGVGDDRFTTETCAQQELDTEIKIMTRAHTSLREQLSTDARNVLDTAQEQWLAYRASHCRAFVQIAGQENPAWQMTWSDIAQTACEAELTKERVVQLESLENITHRRATGSQ